MYYNKSSPTRENWDGSVWAQSVYKTIVSNVKTPREMLGYSVHFDRVQFAANILGVHVTGISATKHLSKLWSTWGFCLQQWEQSDLMFLVLQWIILNWSLFWIIFLEYQQKGIPTFTWIVNCNFPLLMQLKICLLQLTPLKLLQLYVYVNFS